jgi:hypothetical protein
MTARRRETVTVAAVLVLLAAAGCTGTDTLENGNVTVSFEFVLTNPGSLSYDCVNVESGPIIISPVDGACSAGSSSPGMPCFTNSDCSGGTCEGAHYQQDIQGGGILVLSTGKPGNTAGVACVPSSSGLCKDFSVPDGGQGPCTIDADCDPGEFCQANDTFFKLPKPALALPPVVVPSGRYRIDVLGFGFPSLYDEATATGLRCGASAFNVIEQFAADYPLEGRLYTFGPGEPNVVRIALDVQALEQALIASTCDQVVPTFLEFQ